MRPVIALPALLFTSLSGCAVQPDPNADAKAAVRLLLDDPGSANFEFVNAGDGLVCGMVNAKNALGGYAGPQAFIVENGQALLDTGQPDFGKSFAWKCPSETASAYLQIEGARIHQRVDELEGQLNAAN